MKFDFEISRVECVSKENYYSHFNAKIHLSHLNHTSPLPTFFSKKKKFLKYKIYAYAFSVYSVDYPLTEPRISSYRTGGL